MCNPPLYAFSPVIHQLNKDGSGAKLLKSAVVKTPLSVYEATAGRELYRPVQTSPIPNFFLAGCFTKQKYLASMEGATFSGKLAARALADAAIAGKVSLSQHSAQKFSFDIQCTVDLDRSFYHHGRPNAKAG